MQPGEPIQHSLTIAEKDSSRQNRLAPKNMTRGRSLSVYGTQHENQHQHFRISFCIKQIMELIRSIYLLVERTTNTIHWFIRSEFIVGPSFFFALCFFCVCSRPTSHRRTVAHTPAAHTPAAPFRMYPYYLSSAGNIFFIWFASAETSLFCSSVIWGYAVMTACNIPDNCFGFILRGHFPARFNVTILLWAHGEHDPVWMRHLPIISTGPSHTVCTATLCQLYSSVLCETMVSVSETHILPQAHP